MRKRHTIMTGFALISVLTLSGCTQTKGNFIASSPKTNTTKNTVATAPTNNKTAGNQGSGGVATPNGVAFSQLNTESLSSVSFSSSKLGFLSSKYDIYKTMDGGKSWTKVYTSKNPILGLEAKYQSEVKDETVVAYTKTNLIISRDGQHFKRIVVPGNNEDGSGTNIQGIALLNTGLYGILNNGVVWKVDGESGAFYRSTPTSTVSSLTTAWDSNNYDVATGYAVSGTSVYKSSDSQHWKKTFVAPIHGSYPWKSQIQACGGHVAVLLYGGDTSENQTAYILYESNDSGKTWKPIVDEPNFASDYRDLKPLDNTVVAQQPGIFTMDSKGDVFITGLDADGNISILAVISPTGKTLVYDPIGPSANSPNVFDQLPMGISTTDGKHIFVVGGKNGKGVLETSQDGGLIFQHQ